MIPHLHSPTPPLRYALSVFGLIGFSTATMANKMHNLPMFFRPHRVLIGTALGILSGYVIHHVTLYARKDLLEREAWQNKELARKKELIKQSIAEYEAKTGQKV